MTIRDFFVSPATKGVIIGILTIIVGVISSIFANKHEVEPKWWAYLGIAAIVELVVIILYSINEKNALKELKDENNDLTQINDNLNSRLQNHDNRIHDFEAAMQGIKDLCDYCAKQTNLQIHEIIDTGNIDCKTWNFDSASTATCKEIYRSIIENSHVRSQHGDILPNVKISYVKLVEDGKSSASQDRENLKIALSGYYHPANAKQKDLGFVKTIKDIVNKKHYAKLFMDDIDQHIFYNGVENVKEKTGNANSPYSQYIAIPVRCATINQQSKLVGLLLVLCYNGSTLSDNENELNYLIYHFFSIYANLFLLLYKLDKAMRAMPAKENNDKEKIAANVPQQPAVQPYRR